MICLSAVTLLTFSSCVTKKKYLLAENGRLEAVARGNDLQNQLVDCRNTGDALRSELGQLKCDTTSISQLSRH